MNKQKIKNELPLLTEYAVIGVVDLLNQTAPLGSKARIEIKTPALIEAVVTLPQPVREIDVEFKYI